MFEEFEKALSVRGGTATITISADTVYGGQIVAPGDVFTVDKSEAADARYLLGIGKAVLGDKSADFKAAAAKADKANKAIGAEGLTTK